MMAVDAAQRILDTLNSLKTEIQLLSQKIEELSKCKNDHEERIRHMEVSQAKYIGYTTIGMSIIFIIIQYIFKVV